MDDCLFWASFCTNKECSLALGKVTIALMPLFLDSAHSVTMLKHHMITSKKAIQCLSSDQVLVIVMNQPLYALAVQFN